MPTLSGGGGGWGGVFVILILAGELPLLSAPLIGQNILKAIS